MAGREVAAPRGHQRGPRPGGPVLQRDDERRDQRHQYGRRGGRQPPAVRARRAAAPRGVRQGEDEHRDGDLDVAEVGEEFREPVRTDELPAQPRVEAQERAVGDDLPDDQGEQERGQGQERVLRARIR
ncbi:hypothetical protein [Streptomyces sp. NPDC001340]